MFFFRQFTRQSTYIFLFPSAFSPPVKEKKKESLNLYRFLSGYNKKRLMCAPHFTWDENMSADWIFIRQFSLQINEHFFIWTTKRSCSLFAVHSINILTVVFGNAFKDIPNKNTLIYCTPWILCSFWAQNTGFQWKQRELWNDWFLRNCIPGLW